MRKHSIALRTTFIAEANIRHECEFGKTYLFVNMIQPTNKSYSEEVKLQNPILNQI
jgi:hypothetical protein